MAKKVIPKWVFFLAGIIAVLVLIKGYIFFSEKEYAFLSKKFYTEYTELANQLVNIDSIESILEIVKKEENQNRISLMIESVQQLKVKTPSWKYKYYHEMSEKTKGIINMNECTRIEYKDISIDRRSEIAYIITIMRADFLHLKNKETSVIFW